MLRLYHRLHTAWSRGSIRNTGADHTRVFPNLRGTAAPSVSTKHFEEAYTRQRKQSNIFENGNTQQSRQKAEKIGVSTILKYLRRLHEFYTAVLASVHYQVRSNIFSPIFYVRISNASFWLYPQRLVKFTSSVEFKPSPDMTTRSSYSVDSPRLSLVSCSACAHLCTHIFRVYASREYVQLSSCNSNR